MPIESRAVFASSITDGSLSKRAILVHSSTKLSWSVLFNFSYNLHNDQMQLLLTPDSLSIFKLIKSCSAANWAFSKETFPISAKELDDHNLTAATSFFKAFINGSKTIWLS